MKLIFTALIALLSCGAWAAEPIEDLCHQASHPSLGQIGTCIPQAECTSGNFMEDACPSYPQGYECCFDAMDPGREVRGAWVATVANIDWPKSPTSSVATQQTELRFLVDQMEIAGINAIYFQVRPHGDALYNSPLEPWSEYITGTQGQAPNPLWDPLEFIIDYAHPKGMEVHAWINPYRANMRASSAGLAANHMARLYPNYAYSYSTYLWMDPGSEEVQNRTYSVAIDIVTRYDVDGFHMDDYFYPYPVSGVPFPDSQTYAAYQAGGGSLGLADWRRNNVNRLVERMNNGLHEVKPWIKFSISPFGIYRPGEPEGMPSPITGLDQYSQLYSDPKLWLQQGWVDVLQPQLYWLIDPPAQSYPTLLNWWVDTNQNPLRRHVYGGNYLSRVDIDNWPLSEILNQIRISRQEHNRARGSWGNVQFSAKMFRDNTKGTTDYFRDSIYKHPALQPVFPWLASSKTPLTPPAVHVSGNTVTWSTVGEAIFKLALYKENPAPKRPWELVKVVGNVGSTLSGAMSLEPGTYALSCVDRVGRESSRIQFHI